MIGEIFAICSVLTFVISNTLFKRIDSFVSPSQINAFRTVVGALTFIIIAAIAGQIGIIFQFPWQLWLWLIASIIFGQVLGDTSYFKAQEMLGTTIALAISMTFPIFTLIISFFLGTTIPIYFYGSLALVSIGITIISIGKHRANKKKIAELLKEKKELEEESKKVEEIMEENTSEEKNETILEIEKITIIDSLMISSDIEKKKLFKKLILAIFIAFSVALSWAIGIVLTEKAINDVTVFVGSSDYSSLLGNIARFPVAAGILTIMSFGDKKTKIRTWSKCTWILLFVGALIGTSLGAYLYTEAIFRVNAVFVSIIGTSSPIFSIPISWLVNREKINLLGLLGVSITTGGVVLILVFQLLQS